MFVAGSHSIIHVYGAVVGHFEKADQGAERKGLSLPGDFPGLLFIASSGGCLGVIGCTLLLQCGW